MVNVRTFQSMKCLLYRCEMLFVDISNSNCMISGNIFSSSLPTATPRFQIFAMIIYDILCCLLK